MICGGFVAITVALALAYANIFLALAGVIIGMLVMWIAKSRTKEIIVDERIMSASEKAGRMTYIIIVSVLGWTSVILMFLNQGHYFPYMESLALIFAYTCIFIIVIYSISYYFFLNRSGGKDDK